MSADVSFIRTTEQDSIHNSSIKHKVRFQGDAPSPITAASKMSQQTYKRRRRGITNHLLPRLLKDLKHTWDKKEISHRASNKPASANATKPSQLTRKSTSSSLASVSQDSKSFPLMRIKKYLSPLRRWRKRRLDSGSRRAGNTAPRRIVDWDAVDLQALDPVILRQNAEAMRDASHEAAETLRKHKGWIREHESFDDSAWVEREDNGDKSEWETDNEDGMNTGTVRPLQTRISLRRSPNRQHFNTLTRRGTHRHLEAGRSVPSLYHSDSSPRSSMIIPPTPKASAIRQLRGEDALHHDGMARRQLPAYDTEPIIIISDWDEEMNRLNNISNPDSSRVGGQMVFSPDERIFQGKQRGKLAPSTNLLAFEDTDMMDATILSVRKPSVDLSMGQAYLSAIGQSTS